MSASHDFLCNDPREQRFRASRNDEYANMRAVTG